MKVTIDIECTPQEARAFLGLPDVTAMQQQLMSAFQEQLRQQMSADPETAMKAWFSPGFQGLGEMQRNWWQQMFKAAESKPE